MIKKAVPKSQKAAGVSSTTRPVPKESERVGLELVFQDCFNPLLMFLHQILKSMNTIKLMLYLDEAVTSNVRLVSLWPYQGALTIVLNLACSVYVGANFCILPICLVSFLCLHSLLISLKALFVCLFSFCLSTETLFISCLSLLSVATPKTDEKQSPHTSVILKIVGKHR